jgi:prepilin-type N-terminal cleavage/methylation domain-containing protein
MHSNVLHLQHSRTRSYVDGIFSGSPKSLVSGICRARVRQIPRGFTLVEIAIAIFIITLLLGSILVPLTTQVEQRQISETQKVLEEIREALLGFAVAKGHLPCPDKTTAAGAGTANDGIEDWNGAECVDASNLIHRGSVPWATLGVGASDVWGNRFRYQVTAAYAQRPTTFTLTTPGTLRVCTTGACSAFLTTDAVAVIISLGKNGLGAINANTGNANPAPPISSDEYENLEGPTNFLSRTMSPAGSAAGEFDDIVIWLSKHTLFNRMIAARKLP